MVPFIFLIYCLRVLIIVKTDSYDLFNLKSLYVLHNLKTNFLSKSYYCFD